MCVSFHATIGPPKLLPLRISDLVPAGETPSISDRDRRFPYRLSSGQKAGSARTTGARTARSRAGGLAPLPRSGHGLLRSQLSVAGRYAPPDRCQVLPRLSMHQRRPDVRQERPAQLTTPQALAGGPSTSARPSVNGRCCRRRPRGSNRPPRLNSPRYHLPPGPWSGSAEGWRSNCSSGASVRRSRRSRPAAGLRSWYRPRRPSHSRHRVGRL